MEILFEREIPFTGNQIFMFMIVMFICLYLLCSKKVKREDNGNVNKNMLPPGPKPDISIPQSKNPTSPPPKPADKISMPVPLKTFEKTCANCAMIGDLNMALFCMKTYDLPVIECKPEHGIKELKLKGEIVFNLIPDEKTCSQWTEKE